jgi:cytochrome c peroxidase
MYQNCLQNSLFKSYSLAKNIKLKKAILFVALAIFLTACNDKDPEVVIPIPPTGPIESTLDTDIRAIIASQNLTGDPSLGRALPNIEEPIAQLGMKLFFTKSLGGELDSACVSCHHPMLGGGDDLALPVGVDAEMVDLLGPGRFHSVNGEHFDGGPTVPRNSPTTFNVALWDRFLFHDGRVESLGKTPKLGGDDGAGIRTPDLPFGQIDSEAGQNLVAAQARFPVTSKEEMADFSTFEGINNTEIRQNLEQRIGDYGNPLGGMLIFPQFSRHSACL